jgi:hypothetical protein
MPPEPQFISNGSSISALLPAEADEPTACRKPAATRPEDICADDSAARLAYDIFTALFGSEDSPLPADTRVLGVRFRSGVLTVNVSEEILSVGGNENERLLVAALVEAAHGVPGAAHLTLLIEGELRPLPEGRIVDIQLETFPQ